MKIVVRAPNWIGDSILALPTLAALKEHDPNSEIWVCGQHWVSAIFLPMEEVRGVIPLKNPGRNSALFHNVRELKKHRFDAGLLLTNSFASALLFFLAGIPERWGYDRDFRRRLLTKRVPADQKALAVHQAEYYLNLLTGLGIAAAPRPLALTVPATVKEQARNLLSASGITFARPLVVINPGAFYGSAKRWTEPGFAALASRLQKETGADIVFVGSEEEKPLAEAIKARMEHPPLVLNGQTTVSLLAGILLHASLFISNDSGPMHMANALGVPVVAVFGPTDPSLTGPYQPPSAYVKKDTDCWPCRHRDCPTDHRCMEQISAGDVYERCVSLIR